MLQCFDGSKKYLEKMEKILRYLFVPLERKGILHKMKEDDDDVSFFLAVYFANVMKLGRK